MADVKYPNGTTGDSKSYTVTNNSSEYSTARNLYYKDIPESKTVRLVDLSEDSINKIAEAVARKIAIDGAEVIRCKDCKLWNSDKETCIENGGLWRASDFCSWAERR